MLRLGDNSGFAGLRGLSLLLLTSLPAGLLGLLARGPIKEYLFQPLTVALGLAAGAVWILAVRRWPPRQQCAGDALRWRDALAVGLFPVPGPVARHVAFFVNDSGWHDAGHRCKTAAEYSFFAAVPL